MKRLNHANVFRQSAHVPRHYMFKGVGTSSEILINTVKKNVKVKTSLKVLKYLLITVK